MKDLNKLTTDVVENTFQNLKSEFLEMAQLKSNFDIEKFTVRKEGPFIAHSFHFLMRQYSLALYELRRMVIDREERNRREKEYNDLLGNGQKKIQVTTGNGQESKYLDLEIERLKNENDLQLLSLKNKYEMCSYFEKCRQKLIKLNGGNAPTNEQYQKEEPEYWAWFLKREAVMQARERSTGIREGVWVNIEHLEQPPLINPEFQVKMLDDMGNMDLGKAHIDNESKKGLMDRVKNIIKLSVRNNIKTERI